MADPWIRGVVEAAWPALGAPRSLRPGARYDAVYPRAVLVLQTGPNASVDYYLRPRLQADPTRPWAVTNLATPPDQVALLNEPGLWIVICRYIDSRWIEAIRRARPNLSGVAFFVDDDLPAMITQPGSPFETRLKVSTRYARFIADLESVTSDVWVSTPALAERFDGPVRIVPPVPFDPPRPPKRDEAAVIVYHGTLTHHAERAFLNAVSKRLDRAPLALRLEIAGGVGTRLTWAGRRKAVVRPERPWLDYLKEQRARSAAVLLAPLTDGPVNAARAAVKVFDAARLGAVGLFADKTPYREVVRDCVDGRLLAMDADDWTEATLDLLAHPARRFEMARAAFETISAQRAAIRGFFDGVDR